MKFLVVVTPPYIYQTLSRISVTLLVTHNRVKASAEKTLPRLSATKLTTLVISLPSEGDTLSFHNLISSILVALGYNPRERGGRFGSFLGFEKAVIIPAGY